MQETEKKPAISILDRVRCGLGTKLIVLLLGAMLVIFSLLGYLTIRLQRQDLEAATLLSAERISDVIRRNTSDYMLRNDREGLHHAMSAMASEPGMVRVRVFDREGHISYSSDPFGERTESVDKDAEACYGCHAHGQTLTHSNRPDRFRVYRAQEERVLGDNHARSRIRPSAPTPTATRIRPASRFWACSIPTSPSPAPTSNWREGSWRMIACDVLAMAAIAFLSWIFIRRMVDRPLKQLQAGTQKLSEGGLGHQIELRSNDEIGDLAESFNPMSLQLRGANEELVAWAHTLEERVEEKTSELRRAHNEVLHVETMASVGKMAAVVAHEINNPLSGILTYSKLLKKWVDQRTRSARRKRKRRNSAWT